MSKVISFINYKGGVGKTTTTYHIGCSLAHHHGKRVLLVDIDPQTNLTFLSVSYEDWKRFKQNHGTIKTLYSRYQKNQPPQTKRYIWQSPIGRGRTTSVSKVDIIPCDIDLLGEDLSVTELHGRYSSGSNPFQALQQDAKTALKKWLFLKSALEEVKDYYDYVLIDCPPNIYMMTQNALVASQWYVVTTIPEFLSLVGMQILHRKVNEIRERVTQVSQLAGRSDVNVGNLGGIILVKVRIGGEVLTNQHAAGIVDINNTFSDECFEEYTTELIGYSEAAEYRLPVWLTNTSSARRAASKLQYQNITEEFLRRF